MLVQRGLCFLNEFFIALGVIFLIHYELVLPSIGNREPGPEGRESPHYSRDDKGISGICTTKHI